MLVPVTSNIFSDIVANGLYVQRTNTTEGMVIIKQYLGASSPVFLGGVRNPAADITGTSNYPYNLVYYGLAGDVLYGAATLDNGTQYSLSQFILSDFSGTNVHGSYTYNGIELYYVVSHESVGDGKYRDWAIAPTLYENPYDALVDAYYEIGVQGLPIIYSYTNSSVTGPSKATAGDTVTVSAVPDNNYGITDPASQILVTNNDIAVPYQWNPSTNTITFTMPDPS